MNEIKLPVGSEQMAEGNSTPVNASESIDRTIHEPARLTILLYLLLVESADFNYLLHNTGFSKGNLSSHLSKLEEAEYVEITKEFINKIPHTEIKITEKGREAFIEYKAVLLGILDNAGA